MSERCYISDCALAPEVYCSCRVLICNTHIVEHLTSNDNEHSIKKYWEILDQKDLSTLSSMSSHIDELLLLKNSAIDELFQRREQELQAQIQYAKDYALREKEKYFERSEEIKNSISDFIEQKKIPSNLQKDTIRVIKSLKRTSEINEEMPQANKKFKCLAQTLLDDSRGNYSVCANGGWIYTLNSDLQLTQIPNNQFGTAGYSNGLVLPDNSILLVEKNQAIKVFPTDKEIENLPFLNKYRYYHTLGFINDLPAVIGGSYDSMMRDVEVLDGEKWELIEPLVFPRSNATSCNSGNFTYVFGGFGDSEREVILASIERYEIDRWIVLNTKLPIPMGDVGVFALGPSFYILGGGNHYNYYTAVYKWDGENKWEYYKDLNYPCCFPSNQWIFKDNSFIALDNSGLIVQFSIDS